MSFLTDNPVSSWTFLNEPLWRWFVFLSALIVIAVLQRGLIDFIR